jgi:hypothetical protein
MQFPPMNSVKIITSDSLIWQREQVIFDLVKAAIAGPVLVDLLHEGPDCVTIGLDSILDQVRDLLRLPREHFLIKTSNQISSSQYPEQRTGFSELTLANCLAEKTKNTPSTLQHQFGIFIGRSNWQRLGLAAYLFAKYKKQTVMTFHYNHLNDYHRLNFGLEELVNRHWSGLQEVVDFLKHVPITHDEQSYPILWNKQGFNLQEQYSSIFVEIVCETYFTGRTFFITEKTLRCIINRRPFIIQGPKHYLKNLQTLGFQTFDRWWDEGYDTDPSDARFETLCNGIDWIAEQSGATIKQWYKEMQPVLEHNVQCLKNLTTKQILNAEFKYD